MTAIDDLMNTWSRLTAGIDLDRVPQQFNCAPDVWATLRAHLETRPAAQPDYRSGTLGGLNALMGLRIVIDHDLEPGAWQVLGRNDVLLHDSRSPR